MNRPSDGGPERSETLRIRLAYAAETGKGARLSANECLFVVDAIHFYEAQIKAVMEMARRTGGGT